MSLDLSELMQAQRQWAGLSVGFRKYQLKKMYKWLVKHDADIISRVQQINKPAFEAATHEVGATLDTFKYWLKNIKKFMKPNKVRHGNPILRSKKSAIHYEPLGIIGIITSWNYPLSVPMGQIIPALAAGNAVVFKPSELAKGTKELFKDMIAGSGFPSNLIHILESDDREYSVQLGINIIQSPLVDKIFFTGSTQSGRIAAKYAHEKLKPIVLELGGKDIAIVMPDADLRTTLEGIKWGAFTNNGQACASIETVLVHSSIFQEFLRQCETSLKELNMPTFDKFISPENKKRIQSILEDARDKGAEAIPYFKLGCFLYNIEPEMRLCFEEIFGPVAAIIPYDKYAEAIEFVNNNLYGLTASIWTQNKIHKAKRIAKLLDVGTVTINDHLYTAGSPELPWGGERYTGRGRTHGYQGFLECVKTKVISTSKNKYQPWWYPYSDKKREAFEYGNRILHGHWRYITKFIRHPSYMLYLLGWKE